MGNASLRKSWIKRLRPKAQIALSGRLCGPIFADPRFPTLTGSRDPIRDGKCRDFGIRNLDPLVRILRQNTHKGALQVSAGDTVKNIAVDFASIFPGDGDVSAEIEGLF